MADRNSRGGARYATADILHYLDSLYVRHDAALSAAFEAPEHDGLPAIMVSPSEGRLLGLLLRLVGARRVVEVGTLAGYSTIHLARAVGAGGHVWSVEVNPAHADVARRNLVRAGLADRVDVVVGRALDVLPTLPGEPPLDAVFLDADKENYDRYADWALPHLRPGGLLIADNAYLFGELLSDSDAARNMRRFHERLSTCCESVCIPTPDGLALGIKRRNDTP